MSNDTTKAETAEFAGKRILVTGDTRGIGAAIVERFRNGGGIVITTGRPSATKVYSEYGLISRHYGRPLMALIKSTSF